MSIKDRIIKIVLYCFSQLIWWVLILAFIFLIGTVYKGYKGYSKPVLRYELNTNDNSYSVVSTGLPLFRSKFEGTINIPDKYENMPVTSIGDNAFKGCSKLTDITISDSVTSIGDEAFKGCSRLTSIIISDSVTSIGKNAFNGCSNLTEIIFTGTIWQWDKIKKGSSWNYNTGDYTVHCTDGNIKKGKY